MPLYNPLTPYFTQNVSKNMTANNTTVSVQLWRITGVVLVLELYGIITTTLGSNHTAAHFRINDQSATDPITSATGQDFSSYPAGGILYKGGPASDPVNGENSSTGNIVENSMGLIPFTSFFAIQKTGGVNTDIEYRYTTTNAPTTGAIQFFIKYIPLSADGALTVL